MKIRRLKNLIHALALASLLTGDIKAGAEEVKIEKKKQPFSLETMISYGNIGEETPNADLDIFGEYQFDSGYKILGDLRIENGLPTKTVFAAGNPNIYLGAKWENLSNETSLLEDANLFKLETGVRDIANFLNISSFVAYTSIPNMKTVWVKYKYPDGSDGETYYKTPLYLYTIGTDGTINPRFRLKESVISPWISGKILINEALIKNTEEIDLIYDASLSKLAFNHFNTGLGADLSTKNFDFGLENYLEGNYDPFMLGTKHKIKARLHKKDNFLQYTFTINLKFNQFYWPANLDLESCVDFRLHFTPEVYIKGTTNINHSTKENPNLIAVWGYLNKNGVNVELFCNLESKIIGINLSNRNLGNKLERYSKEPFADIHTSTVDEYSPIPKDSLGNSLIGNINAIHSEWGEDISDVIDKIKSKTRDYNSAMREISRYASYFQWKEDGHYAFFSAEQEHDLGYGVCKDTNGKLLPTIINGVLRNRGYQSWGRALMGPYVGHAVTIIKKPNKRYDIMNYDDVYFLDAETEEKAIDSVYPGAYAYDGGEYSETSQRIINSLEESVWR